MREYLLTDLDVPAMVEVIRRPTSRQHLPHAAEVPFEKYGGFDYADGVPEEIARQVARHGRTDGVALLLQVICAQLFEHAMARDDHRVTEDDLRELGGFEGALSRHAERQITALFPAEKSDRTRFKWLLTGLTLRQGDGTLTTDRAPRGEPERGMEWPYSVRCGVTDRVRLSAVTDHHPTARREPGGTTGEPGPRRPGEGGRAVAVRSWSARPSEQSG